MYDKSMRKKVEEILRLADEVFHCTRTADVPDKRRSAMQWAIKEIDIQARKVIKVIDEIELHNRQGNDCRTDK